MAVAALALRKNRAAVRFWLWLAASMKFLVPYALLMEVGELVRRQPALAAAPQLDRWAGIQDAGQAVFTPSSVIVTATTPAQSHADIWFAVIAAVWVCGFLFVAIRWVVQWRAIRTLVRKAKPIDLRLPIPTVSAAARLEPGVFGIFRPALFLPEGISARLTPEQMQALVAHELCHVRRRDNLWAAVHVLVEAVFWFHPLVWWLGARMIAEREAACDEAVLQSGAEAEAYATSVLEVCRIYAASPMLAIAGITGADLKQRVITIASQSFGRSLNSGKKLALALGAIATLATPIVFGLVSLPLVRALDKDEIARLPRFEVASIRPFVPIPGQRPTPPGIYPGGRAILRGTVQGLLMQAFNVQPFQISGLPDWATNGGSAFEIEAIPPDSSPSKTSNQFTSILLLTDEQRQMILALLIDRFQLQFHTVTKTGDVSFLVRGDGKLQLQPPADTTKLPRFAFSRNDPPVGMDGTNISMPDFASLLVHFLYLQHPLIDETGLKGSYDFHFPRELYPCGRDCNEEDTEIAYITKSLHGIGLDVKPRKEPVEAIVIDHVEKPSPN
jgi:uncharacterized protein (TIGR03435 family)